MNVVADPVLSFACRTQVAMVQREEPVTNTRFRAVQFHDSQSRLAAVRVSRQSTEAV
jgi:hypothetical protein